MATLGYPKSTLSYDTFFNNVDFMSTEFEKRTVLMIQLQERIQTTLKSIDGIKDAVVTIDVPEQKDYVLAENRQESRAAVTLTLEPGVTLSPSQIKGIRSMVAKSVPNLKPENVTMIDSSGNPLDDNMTSGQTDILAARMDYEKKLEDRYNAKVRTLLADVFGADKIKIVTTVSIDYDKKQTVDTNYYPTAGTEGVLYHEDLTEKSQTGSSSGGVPGAENNAEVPTTPNVENNSNTNVTDKTSSKDWYVSNLKTQMEKDGYSLKDVSIAVMINKADLEEQTKEQIVEQISTITGINSTSVSVVNMPFEGAAGNNEPALSRPLVLIAIGSSALLVLIIIALVVMLIMNRRKKKRLALEAAAAAAANGGDVSQFFGDGAAGDGKDVTVKPIELNESRQQMLRREIIEFAMANPQIAAQLIEVWLRGDTED